uniref:DNA topoisomerase 2 n=1 Tax=Strongyloides venezuelensis TaxID=75913 RepID=A0A0K0F960_STRVS
MLFRNVLYKRVFCSIVSKYRKQDLRENILLRPDSYIGSTNDVTCYQFLFNDKINKMIRSEVSYVPAFVKIFDEILVNAADNKQRDPNMTFIDISVSNYEEIRIRNNGKCIPIHVHPTMDLYIPTLLMGHLLTSSNYDDNEKRIVGGRNGYGAKLCNIYSKQFSITCFDSKNNKKFSQTWYDNMSKCDVPTIEEVQHSNGEDYTEVSFIPDLSRFNMKSINNEVINILRKRAFDIAGTCDGIKVSFNGDLINVSNFEEYVNLYLLEMKETLKVFKTKRWEIYISQSLQGFQQVSFVNNIATLNGGNHVNYITNQIITHIKDLLKKKIDVTRLKNFHIQSNLNVFIKCNIENPTFNSQTKEQLTSKVSEFGSKCVIPKFFISDFLENSTILESIENSTKRQSVRTTKKAKRLFNPKLVDAFYAGSGNSRECSLFLTEGDSAKALVIAGLSVIGKDYYGVFPLKGKIVNVRDLSFNDLMENDVFRNIVEIVNLNENFDYSQDHNRNSLRYGKVILFCDQDFDGMHIKGLIINLFHKFWPELVESGFIQTFKTPLFKVTRNKEVFNFYSKFDFDEWLNKRENKENLSKCTIKYYKGLGTSTEEEAKEYFKEFDKNLITFTCNSEKDHLSIKNAFSKISTSDRKEMIQNHISTSTSGSNFLPISTFTNSDLADFFKYDIKRSIPNVIDGLKPSQRKVLYTMFNKKFKNGKIKVNQLAAITADFSLYHHGEDFLTSTIVKMAQNFVGAGNINLLEPDGQFGTRACGGNDSAAGRYIHTYLNPLTRLLFPKEDDKLLNYTKEENQITEPFYYVPIIPTILVNGGKGVGTGWNTFVCPYNPIDIINNIRLMLDEKEPVKMVPYFRNFEGTVTETKTNGLFEIKGISRVFVNDLENTLKIVITELPIGLWTDTFKEKIIQPFHEKKILKSFRESSSNNKIYFEITLSNEKKVPCKLAKSLKKLVNTRSMVLLDGRDNLKHYKDTNEIFKEFFDIRKNLYEKRLLNEINILSRQLLIYKNQRDYINSILSNKMSLMNKSKEIMIENLKLKGFCSNPLKENSNDYEYLTNISLYQFTDKEISKLEQKIAEESKKISSYEMLTWKDLWKNDLDNFEASYKP